MSACFNCHQDNPVASEFCHACGSRLQEGISQASNDKPSPLERLEKALGGRDSSSLHILLSCLGGSLLAIPFVMVRLGSEAAGTPGVLIAYVLGQVLFASIIVYFLAGYMLKGEWPWFSLIDQHLGGQDSAQRHIAYSLFASFLVVLVVGPPPNLGDAVEVLESWLLLALVLVFPIGYWLTGSVPLSGIANSILGEDISYRRRTIFAALLCVPYMMNGSSDIRHLVGWFLSMFFLMGFTTNWRQLPFENSVLLDDAQGKYSMTHHMILDHVKRREILDMVITETDTAKTSLYTTAISSGTQGRQILLTCGQVRLAIFIQDYGKDLFVRWIGYYDLSGRRLWLLIGMVLAFFNRLTYRFTGTSYLAYFAQTLLILTPRSRHQTNLDTGAAGYFSTLFGLIDGISVQTRNEILALEGAITNTVSTSVRHVLISQGREDQVDALMSRSLKYELGAAPLATGAAL